MERWLTLKEIKNIQQVIKLPNIQNIDAIMPSIIFESVESNLTVYLEASKFSAGGHVERSSYTVPKTTKPPPPPDNSFKELTQKYFEQKDEELKKYEEEIAEKQRKELEARLKREQELEQEEKRKRDALLDEIRKNDRDR